MRKRDIFYFMVIILEMIVMRIFYIKKEFLEDNTIIDNNAKLKEKNDVLFQWIDIKQKGESIGQILLEKGYKKIAIYGIYDLGERLYYELKDSSIEVKYIIDRNPSTKISDVEIYKPTDDFETVDAIIVTAIHYFDEIKNDLAKKMNCPILSLEDVVMKLI